MRRACRHAVTSVRDRCTLNRRVKDDSTAEYDKGDKFDLLYRTLGSLREYVLVETTQIGVGERRRQPDDTWSTGWYGPHDELLLESIGTRFVGADLSR